MHKWTLLILFCAACVLGTAALFLAIPDPTSQDGEAAEEPAAEDMPLNVAAAEQVYSNNCLSCHGDQLQGGVGPELARVGSKLSREELADIIMNGSGGLMPAFKNALGNEEINNLAKWLSEHK